MRLEGETGAIGLDLAADFSPVPTVGRTSADHDRMPRPALSRLLPALVAALLVGVALLVPPAAYADPGVITGSVADPEENPLGGVSVEMVPAGNPEGAPVASATTAEAGEDIGDFSVAAPPAGAYWVRYTKAGFATTFLENGIDDGPVTLTVHADGLLSAPDLDVSDNDLGEVTLLRPAPTMTSKPVLSGKVAAGETVTLSPGSWSIKTDPDYLTVSWFLDGREADDFSDGAWFQKFEVPLAAVGKTLTYTITVDDPSGARVPATYSDSAGTVAKATAAVTGTVANGKVLNIRVAVRGVTSPRGAVVVKAKKKTIGTVTLKAKGKAKLKLPALKPGKHTLTVSYAGSGQIAAASTTIKLTVKKGR